MRCKKMTRGNYWPENVMDLPRENSERLTHDASPRWCDRRRVGPGRSAHQDISEPCQQPTSASWGRNGQEEPNCCYRAGGWPAGWCRLGWAPQSAGRLATYLPRIGRALGFALSHKASVAEGPGLLAHGCPTIAPGLEEETLIGMDRWTEA